MKLESIASYVGHMFQLMCNSQGCQVFRNILTSNLKWKQLSPWFADFSKNLRFSKTTIFILNYWLRYSGMPSISEFSLSVLFYEWKELSQFCMLVLKFLKFIPILKRRSTSKFLFVYIYKMNNSKYNGIHPCVTFVLLCWE